MPKRQPSKRPKQKLIYKEAYTPPGGRIRDDCLPEMRHLLAGWKVHEAFIREAGVVERDGKRMEYQDIRVYIEECTDINCTLCGGRRKTPRLAGDLRD